MRIRRKRGTIIRNDNEILCNTAHGTLFRKMDNLGNATVKTYLSKNKAEAAYKILCDKFDFPKNDSVKAVDVYETYEIGNAILYENFRDDNFGLLVNCAIRYALGRQTYVPSALISYIEPLLPCLDDRTLGCISRDLDKDNVISYGDEQIDKPLWLNFEKKVNAELKKRNAKK